MYILVIGLIIFITVLLVLVILAQNSKGGGLTSGFGGSAASNIIGVRKTGDLLEKLTWGFIIAIIALSISTNFIRPNAQGTTNEIFDKASEQSAPIPAPALNGGTTTEPAAADSTPE